jgi:hypothetical protein
MTDEMNLELALEMYAEMKAELAPALETLKALEKDIKAYVLETGEVAEGGGLYISIRKGYARPSWDTRKLAGYAVAHPEILEFRKMTDVKPSAVIKVTK